MNLYGKLGGNSDHFVTVCHLKEDLYIFNLSSTNITFTSSDKIDEDECFIIPEFKSKIAKPWSCFDTGLDATYPEANDAELVKIIAFIEKRAHYFYIQRVYPSKSVTKKKWFSLSSRTINEDTVIPVNDNADAVYDSEKDILYFKDFSRIYPIFSGLEELSREANMNELKTFIDKFPIKFDNSFGMTDIKKANLKRVHSSFPLNYDLDKMMPDLKKYAKDYNVTTDDGGNFVIGTDFDFKNFLWIVNERFHVSAISKQPRIATSVRRCGTFKSVKSKKPALKRNLK